MAVAEMKDDFSRYLRLAAKEEVVIGFESEDDWFEYRLEHDPSFLAQVTEARAALRRGEGVPLEEIAE